MHTLRLLEMAHEIATEGIQTPRELLAPAYRDAHAGDFDSLVTHFVAKRRS